MKLTEQQLREILEARIAYLRGDALAQGHKSTALALDLALATLQVGEARSKGVTH